MGDREKSAGRTWLDDQRDFLAEELDLWATRLRPRSALLQVQICRSYPTAAWSYTVFRPAKASFFTCRRVCLCWDGVEAILISRHEDDRLEIPAADVDRLISRLESESLSLKFVRCFADTNIGEFTCRYRGQLQAVSFSWSQTPFAAFEKASLVVWEFCQQIDARHPWPHPIPSEIPLLRGGG